MLWSVSSENFRFSGVFEMGRVDDAEKEGGDVVFGGGVGIRGREGMTMGCVGIGAANVLGGLSFIYWSIASMKEITWRIHPSGNVMCHFARCPSGSDSTVAPVDVDRDTDSPLSV